MPSGFAAFNSANTAAISAAFLSAMSGFVLYLINVRFIIFSMTSAMMCHTSRSQDVWLRPKDSRETKKLAPHPGTRRHRHFTRLERDDAEVAFHAERSARCVARI